MKSSSMAGSVALCCLLALLSVRAVASCKVDNLVDLPVTMEGMVPMVEASFEGKPVRLEADSGGFFSIVTSATAAHYKLKLGPAPNGVYLRGVSGTANFSIATVHDFGLAGLKLHHVPFLVVDSGYAVENNGVLGQNILGLADAEYDLAGGTIRIMRPHDCADVFLGYWAPARQINVVELERTNTEELSTYGTAYVNGIKIKVLFDTGASTSFITAAAAARAGVNPDDAGVVPAGQVRGIGHGRVDTWVAPFATFRMGNEEIRHTHLRIGSGDLGEADMVLGADYFLSHRIFVSYSQKKTYISYNGGPVFNLTTGYAEKSATPSAAALPNVASDGETPLDAEGFARRGAAFMSRQQYASALADLNQSRTLAPTEDKYLLQRSRVYFAMGKRPEAFSDLDHALILRPDNLEALVLRAEERKQDGKTKEAIADLQAADKAAQRDAAIRLEIGQAYLEADQFPQAVAQFDLWIPDHPDDAAMASALNGRCWSRALWGHELDKAANDCNAALKRTRKGDAAYAAFIDSRAMVRLRQGDCASAVSDYNEALALAPNIAWSLYGRGLCERRMGDAEKAAADLAAAKASSADIEDRAKALGIAQ